MISDLVIDDLASKLSKGNLSNVEQDRIFMDLYNLIFPQFENIVYAYMTKNRVKGFNFDDKDYFSILGQSISEAIEGYDITKGEFLARVRSFAYRRFNNVTQYNLAKKRFDKTKQTFSFEELYDRGEFEVEDTNVDDKYRDTLEVIKEFVEKDKEGAIIRILYAYPEGTTRRSALENYFGTTYGEAQRKKVERVRKRLKQHLQNYGVFI